MVDRLEEWLRRMNLIPKGWEQDKYHDLIKANRMTRRSGSRILDAAIIFTRLRSAAKLGCGRGPAWLFFGVSWRDKLLLVVGVAQLVERRSVAPNVAGSIPVSHPKNLSIL